MYRRCSPGARAADPYTVCFPPNTVRPYLGRDPDSNVRLQMRRDNFRDNSPSTSGNWWKLPPRQRLLRQRHVEISMAQ
jgi:hypothetical protein